MSPLKVAIHQGHRVLGPQSDGLSTRDGIQVYWSGDGPGEGKDVARVFDPNGQICKFTFPHPGTSAEINYEVQVAPIEVGEPTTPVTRSLRLERT